MNKQLTTNNAPLTTIKKGYKNTEIGVIPEEWKVKELGEIGSFKNGINKGKEDFGHGFPFVNLMDVFGKPKIYGNEIFDLINSNDAERNLYNLKNNDLLFIRSSVKPSGVGLTSVISKDLKDTVFSGFLIRYRDNGELDVEYKKHCFFEEKFRNRLIASSSVSANTNINQEALKSLKIPLPPLPEQTAIATVLSDTDNLLQALEKKIAKKQLIKKGAMQVLLTPPTDELLGVSGKLLEDENDKLTTNNSQLTTKKEGWVVKTLGEVCDVYSGGTPNTSIAEYYNGSINWISSGDLNKKIIHKVDGTISQKGLNNSSAKIVKKDTLLVAMYGATAGVSAITKIEGAINQAILAILPNDKTNSLFLYYNFQLRKDWIIDTYTQGGQPNLSGNIIKAIEFTFPEIQEQTRIATILSDMDSEIVALEKQLAKYKQVKQGLMQNLLTGKIRLISG